MRRRVRRGRLDAEVEEEIRYHLERRVEALIRAGYSAVEAPLEAERRFGDVAATRAECVASDWRRERRREWSETMSELLGDARHGVRQLVRRPIFAAAAVLTLAIGIGAATAIVGAADHVLFRPLPYPEIDRVMTLWEVPLRSEAGGVREVSPGYFWEWQERSAAFEAMGLAEPTGYDLTLGAHPVPVSAWRVTNGFFVALGIRPVLGRAFSREEYQPGGPPAAVISYALWQRSYGSDPVLTGRTILLDGAAVPVVGVLPPGLEYPEPKDVWTSLVWDAHMRRDWTSSYMDAVARLKPGVTPGAARTDLDRVTRSIPDLEVGEAIGGVRLVALEEHALGEVRPALAVLVAAVAFLLLIACANVAGLVLARGAERGSEIALRAAIGAGRGRLIRQFATESVLLAVIGGVCGMGVAWAGVRLFTALSPPDLPRVGAIQIAARTPWVGG